MAYLGRSPAIGSQKVLDSIESQFNGSLTTFNLRYNNQPIYPALPASLIVSLGGVLQEPREAYTVVSDTIVFASAPPAASDCWILLYSEYGAFVGGATAGDFTVSGDLTLASELHGPANLIIDPAAVGDDTGTVEIKGNLTVQGTTTTINSTTVDLDHLSLGDDEIAYFGNSNDLQIYHESTFNNSVIREIGSGNLLFGGQNIDFRDASLVDSYATFRDNGTNTSVELYYDNSKKFETTSTGVTVTGNLIADNVGIGTDNPSGKLHISSGTSGDATLILEADTDNNNEADNPNIIFRQDGGLDIGAIGLNLTNSSLVDPSNEFYIATSWQNSAIVFATGTTNGYTNATEKLRITSGGNVGIGTDSPDVKLHIEEATGAANDTPEVKVSSFRPTIRLEDKSTSANSAEICGDNALIFRCSVPVDDNTALTEHMRINALGNVGIGTIDPIDLLSVGSSTTADQRISLFSNATSDNESYGSILFRFNIANGNKNAKISALRKTNSSGAELAFYTRTPGDAVNNDGGEERMRITSSGNVGIGTDSPSSILHVSADSAVSAFRIARTDAPASIQSIFANGDAAFRYTVNNAGSWLQGIDDSDADKFKISYGSAADAAFGTNDYLTVDALGVVTAERLRLTAIGDASVSSTGHALQIGLTSGANVIFDNNEIMARNNGAVATLNLNPDGGAITINNNTTAGTFTIGGNTIWHEGNMGDGSTLDADLLDGIEASGFMQTASVSTSSSMKVFYTGMTSQEDYTNSPISIRERGLAGSGDGEDRDAPNLNFHWQGRVSYSLWMNETGQLNYGNYSSTGIPAADGRINAGSFQGPINSDSGDVYCNNNAFIASDATGGPFGDRTSSNIDHFWHDDTAEFGTGGSWVFNSDTTYKNSVSNWSNIKVGHIYVNNGDLGTTAGDTQDLARFISNNSNATSIRLQAKRKLAGTSWESASMKIFCHTDSTEQGYIEFNPHTTTVADGNNHIAFGSGGFEYARFANNGEFGIGTTSPAANLQVEYSLGSNAPSTIRIGTTNNLDIDRIYSIGWGDPSVTQMGIGPYSSTRGIFEPLAPRHGLAIHIHEDDEFSVRSTGWDKLFGVEGGTGRAYHLGNVGFGTVDPQCTIDMTGHIEIEGSAIGGILTSSVAVDNYVEVTPPISGGQLFITSFSTYDNFPQPAGSGQIYYDVGSSPLIAVLVDVEEVRSSTNSLDASLDTSTTATNFAASVATVVALSTGVLRIWNRFGGSRQFKLVFV